MLMRLGSLIFAVPAIVLLVLYGIELGAVSDCISEGGHYDYTSGLCGTEITEQPSFYLRHRLLVDGMLLLSVVGSLLMTWGMLKKGMTRASNDH